MTDDTTANNAYNFRDCSICLETLDSGGSGGAMTFLVPCGHTFHASCYQTWNKTRFLNTGSRRQVSLQCATCSAPVRASYFVCPDHPCILCRQPIYAFATAFTLPDKRLVHAECYEHFQKHGKPIFDRNKTSLLWFPPRRQQQPALISFRGDTVDACHRVFLMNQDSNATNNATLSSFVQRLLQQLSDPERQQSSLDQLLAMVTVTPPKGGCILEEVDPVAALAASFRSPTRQTAIAILTELATVPAVVQALLTHVVVVASGDDRCSGSANHPLSAEIFATGCLLLAMLCNRHPANAAQLVQTDGLATMLFRDISGGENTEASKFGLSCALALFAPPYEQKVSDMLWLESGAVEAVVAAMATRNIDDPGQATIALKFLLELSKTRPRQASRRPLPRLSILSWGQRRPSEFEMRLDAARGHGVLLRISQNSDGANRDAADLAHQLLARASLSSSQSSSSSSPKSSSTGNAVPARAGESEQTEASLQT